MAFGTIEIQNGAPYFADYLLDMIEKLFIDVSLSLLPI
jgi:hypothetical protein